MFPGILPDRIRAMLSSWKRPALVALTTFYLSHIAALPSRKSLIDSCEECFDSLGKLPA